MCHSSNSTANNSSYGALQNGQVHPYSADLAASRRAARWQKKQPSERQGQDHLLRTAAHRVHREEGPSAQHVRSRRTLRTRKEARGQRSEPAQLPASDVDQRFARRLTELEVTRAPPAGCR